MYYQITAPPTASHAKQAEEFTRLLTHSKQMHVQFVTVAGSYKPTRARLTLLTVPDRFADQTARVLALLAGVEEAVKASAALRPRPEWQQTAVLLPTTPDALPLDGTLLDGWDSACLALAYRPGRVLGRLRYCAEDADRVAQLQLDGWQVLRPNRFQHLALGSGRAWADVPSFLPVPGAVSAPSAPLAPAAAPAAPVSHAPAIAEALTDDAAGFVLGVAPDGHTVRLARRALTLSVHGPPEAQQRAVLALLRRGMRAGMGIVAVVDRAALPDEVLRHWEARMRLLDVQNIADSCAIPWRESAPDLLAHAIAGPAATLPALPTRLRAVLDTLGVSALRVPAILGLATMPGDNLRGALAAGGLVVVPQDGDMASALIARMLLAYLATPPALGRGLLVLGNPDVLLPDALRQQAIQVVVGARSDAVVQLHATESGWRVCGPDGSPVAALLPDLMAQPTDGVGDLVESIVQEIQDADQAAPAPAAQPDAPEDGWWAAGTRADDLDAEDAADEPTAAASLDALAWTDATRILDDALPVADDEPPAAVADAAPVAALVDDAEPADESPDVGAALDLALGVAFQALMNAVPADATAARIQAAAAAEHYDDAAAMAVAWATDAPDNAQAWVWRMVLADQDADRAVAAWRALQHDTPHAPLVHAVLAAMHATEVGAWLAGLGADVSAAQLDADAPELRDDTEHAAGDSADQALAVMAPPAAQPPERADAPTDAMLRAAWQAGASLPQLVAQLRACGVDVATARTRVRAIMASGPTTPPPPSTAATAPQAMIVAVVPPVAQAVADRPPATDLPTLLDDAGIWQQWQAGTKTDELTLAICGKRGGRNADAARDRIYSVVVPRIIADLDCDDLADRLAAGEPGADDPRYPELMKRLARSDTPPAGNLERALIKRLISVRQEV